MDWTVLQHIIIALALTGLIGRVTGNYWAGACLGIGIFLGREHAQAEYRWIETFGNHLRANMPWWGGFDYRAWNWPSLFDWITPTVAAIGLAWFCYWRPR